MTRSATLHLVLSAGSAAILVGCSLGDRSTASRTGPEVANSGAVHEGGPAGFVYVANRLSNNVSGYAIDDATGSLVPIPGSPFAAGLHPVDIAADRSGRFLNVANMGDPPTSVFGNLSAYQIDPVTGALTAVGGSPFATSLFPEGVTVHPTGRFVYVANAGDVPAFSVNPASGFLTPIPGSPFLTTGSGPDNVGIDPSGRFAYVTNLAAANVSGFTIDAATGALTPIAGSPFDVGPVPFGVAVDQSGRFLYVSNRNAGTVSGFRIDEATGALTAVPGSPFAAGLDASFVAIAP